MKGDSLSIWIWMIGGIITASLLLLIAQSSLLQLGQQTSRQNVVQDFKGLNQDIKSVCRQAPGAERNRELKLPEVQAIFSTENKSEAPTESPILVANGNTSLGEFVCMSFKDSHQGCVEHSCAINMTYMGVPLEGSDSYIIGEESEFTYDIKVSKKRGYVRVAGNIRP